MIIKKTTSGAGGWREGWREGRRAGGQEEEGRHVGRTAGPAAEARAHRRPQGARNGLPREALTGRPGVNAAFPTDFFYFSQGSRPEKTWPTKTASRLEKKIPYFVSALTIFWYS